MADVVITPGVQWLAAARRPPALAALDGPITRDSTARLSFRGGVLESGFLRTWVANSLADPGERILDDLDSIAEGGDVSAIAPWSAPWFSEPVDSAYWAERSPFPVRSPATYRRS